MKLRGGREYVLVSRGWHVSTAYSAFKDGGITFRMGSSGDWFPYLQGGRDYYRNRPQAAVGTPLFCRLLGYDYEEPPWTT